MTDHVIALIGGFLGGATIFYLAWSAYNQELAAAERLTRD